MSNTEPDQLHAVAAKYTDRPRDCVDELKAQLLDDIADGLELIGIRGGLVDILRLAADDNRATIASTDTEGTQP
jgi:hypothetical protein